MTATSCPGESLALPILQHSRARRLARFLETAFRYDLTGTMTTLFASRALGRTCTRIPLHENLAPRAKILSISALLRTLSALANPCPGISGPRPRSRDQ